MPDDCGNACGFPAVFLRECGNAGVAVLSPIGRTAHHTQPPHWNKTATADRWRIVVALLRSPERESRRLAALLDRLPTDRRRHEIEDDVQRRPGRRSLEGATRTPGGPSCFIANPEFLVRAREGRPL